MKNDSTPLHWSVMAGSVHLIKELIKRGASINIKDGNGSTPLILASAADDSYEMIKILLENKANPNTPTNDTSFPLHHIAIRDDVEGAQLLINFGAKVNCATGDGDTPIHYAAQIGKTKMVKFLIQNGARADYANHEGMLPIHRSINANHVECTAVLAATVNKDTQTTIPVDELSALDPLIQAVYEEKVDMVRVLLNNKADISKLDAQHMTCLHHVAKNGDMKIAELLIENGAKDILEEEDYQGKTPLLVALDNNHFELAKVLLRVGANINKNDDLGYTALHMATVKNQREIVKFLLKSSAQVDKKTSDGMTAFHLALSMGFNECGLDLAAAGADLETINEEENTPIHTAAKRGSKTWLEILIKKGVDVNAVNAQGQTALDLSRGKPKCTQVLLEAGGKSGKGSE